MSKKCSKCHRPQEEYYVPPFYLFDDGILCYDCWKREMYKGNQSVEKYEYRVKNEVPILEKIDEYGMDFCVRSIRNRFKNRNVSYENEIKNAPSCLILKLMSANIHRTKEITETIIIKDDDTYGHYKDNSHYETKKYMITEYLNDEIKKLRPDIYNKYKHII